jgi:hypothetical protein
VVVLVVVLAVVAGGLVVAVVCVVEPFEEEPHPAINEHEIARARAVNFDPVPRPTAEAFAADVSESMSPPFFFTRYKRDAMARDAHAQWPDGPR